jgi:hypothetical protein
MVFNKIEGSSSGYCPANRLHVLVILVIAFFMREPARRHSSNCRSGSSGDEAIVRRIKVAL